MKVWDMAEFEFGGYLDGNGIYRVRFMPAFEGEYQYRIRGSFSDKEYIGSFYADKAYIRWKKLRRCF